MGASAGGRPHRVAQGGRAWAFASCLAASAAAVALAVVPVYRGVESSQRPGGPTIEHQVRMTLVEEDGPGVIAWLVAPAIVLAAPGLARGIVSRRRWRTASAALVLTFSLVAGFSIGLLYLPAGMLGAVAAIRTAHAA